VSFLRHVRSIGPMGEKSKSKPSKPEGGRRLPLVGTRASVKDATEGTRLRLIVRDESHQVSLGGLLSSRARLRFPGCFHFGMKVSGRSTNFQRPASSVLTVCLSSGDHRNELLIRGANSVIFAGPGCGKTTLLHWAYTRLMASKTHVPILFTLRWPDAVGTLREFVDGLVAGRGPKQKDGSVVLLVDGYDEVKQDDRRDVSQALMLFAAANLGSFYLTCRSFYDVRRQYPPVLDPASSSGRLSQYSVLAH
jgi:hypothetical protein